jgi:hypothetical protein
LEVVEIRAIAELQLVFQKAGKHKPDAIIILSSPIFGTNPKLTADLTSNITFRPRHYFPKLTGRWRCRGINPSCCPWLCLGVRAGTSDFRVGQKRRFDLVSATSGFLR